MKILLAGNYRWHVPITRNCADALEGLGCTVARFDSEDRTPPMALAAMRVAKSAAKLVGKKRELSRIFAARIYQRRRRRFLAAIDAFSPDAVVVMRLNHFDVETMQQMRQRMATACWMLEPKSLDTVRQDVPGYDFYYSMHKCHENVGAKYLPVFAHDPANFYPGSGTDKDVPLLFVGSWSLRRQQWLEALMAHAHRLTIIGWNWRKKLGSRHPLYDRVAEDWVDVDGLRSWYQRSGVVININRLGVEDTTGGNLRLADVPACGSVLLTEYSEDLANHFDLKSEVVTFRDPNEMLEQCDRLMASSELQLRVAYAGLAAIQRIGTYRDRMAVIMQDLKSVAASRRSQPRKTV